MEWKKARESVACPTENLSFCGNFARALHRCEIVARVRWWLD
jgi:hypothetical protein